MRLAFTAAITGLVLFATGFSAFAQELSAEETELRLKPSRNLVVLCMQNQGEHTFSGSSDAISVRRITSSEVRYEVYRDGFFLASCISVTVNAP